MTRTLALSLAAALALAAAPARAEQGTDASQQIAEGTVKNGVRTVDMSVTEDGFVPGKVKALKGEKLRLVVTRKTDRTCATEIVIPNYKINTKLPLNKPVTVELTPKASGEIKYACGMDMITGVILVP